MRGRSADNTFASRPLGPASTNRLYRQVYERVRQAILCGNLAPGARVPSTRALAEQLGTARNTVLTAYEQLLAEGYLTGQLGSGTYVCGSLPEQSLYAAPLPRSESSSSAALPPSLSRRGAGLATIPGFLSRDQESACAFRHGLPAIDAFPCDLWGRLTARLWRRKPSHLLAYGDAAGYRPLREALAAYLGTSRGVQCHPDQVIVVSGSKQALDLSARMLLDPGDAVWIEDPGYPGARGAFLAAGARVIPVPVDGEGFDLSAAAAAAPGRGRVRIAYVTPARQYPLGMTMSMARRLALLEWARQANAWIVEDDYDSEYRYAGRPLAALQGIDNHDRVIYVGTFSKVLYPALRLGYVVLPRSLADAFVRARSVTDSHSPTLVQAVLAEFLSAGHFARHVRRMRRLYAERQEIMLRAASRDLAGLLEVEPSDAGMHLIGWLSVSAKDQAVARQAAAEGIIVTPLSSLALRCPQRPGLLLGFTAINARTIREGVRRLAMVLSMSR
jgi:GntR family transcriptional regulator/MocR family aminotransferase